MHVPTTGGLNPEQREIVELLCSDLAEHLAEASSDKEDINAWLEQEAEHCEHMSKAMELAGLQGLSLYCQLLQRGFNQHSAGNNILDDAAQVELAQWPFLLLQYLQQLLEGNDDKAIENAIDALMEAAQQPLWMIDIAQGDWQSLRESLAQTDIVQDESNQPFEINGDTASLAIADDVRPELLQGLLAELPQQSRQFEQAISAFLRDNNIDNLKPAQRLAHTIKGAANIVGIKGLANLMHLCEDLLEGISKQRLPFNNINDLLLDTADCLGEVSDFLSGHGPEPTTLFNILQSLAARFSTVEAVESVQAQDTVDTIEFEFEEDFGEDFDVDLKTPAELETKTGEVDTGAFINPTAAEPDDETETITLTLPYKRAQQLLRIAGESQIANTQVLAQLEGMKTSIEQCERYHRRIKAMANELDALLQTQNALRSAMYRSRSGEHDTENTNSELDPLELESYSELHSFSNQLLELTADSFEAVSHIEAQIDDLHNVAFTQRQLNRDNNDLLLQTHMVAVDSIVPRLQRCVRQACRLTQKNALLEIVGETLLVDNRVLNRIVDPLMHLLRNAVDHGIENDEERTALGKDATGTIAVVFSQQGELIHITCRDDGRGIDWQGVRARALAQQLIDDGDDLDEKALSRLLFLPGFSTREAVSQTSGRGIGLDVVQDAVRQLKGSVQVDNHPQGGTIFTLSLPASILTAHALLVKVGGESASGNRRFRTLSVLSRGIDNVVHVDSSALIQTDDGLYYSYQDNDIPVLSLQDLCSDHNNQHDNISALLIVKRDDGDTVAVGVNGVVASQELVVKPLNAFTYHPPGVVGATILGDGTVSSVVNLLDLPGLNLSRDEYNRLRTQRDATAARDRIAKWELPTALIIDDSLSARQSLSQFVSELGMQVRTAKDGFEAITVMNDTRPNVILVDLEMPRMNGLEFTAHLRANENTRDIPVIMITSRTTEKHRQLADKAGVDDYLNKPWSDEELFGAIQRQMEGHGHAERV